MYWFGEHGVVELIVTKTVGKEIAIEIAIEVAIEITLKVAIEVATVTVTIVVTVASCSVAQRIQTGHPNIFDVQPYGVCIADRVIYTDLTIDNQRHSREPLLTMLSSTLSEKHALVEIKITEGSGTPIRYTTVKITANSLQFPPIIPGNPRES